MSYSLCGRKRVRNNWATKQQQEYSIVLHLVNPIQDTLSEETSSVQFSCSVMSDSLRFHGLQHTRLPYHQLPELAETQVHRVCDAIKPSYPSLFPSPPAFNLSQHQDLFQWVSSLHQVGKVLDTYEVWYYIFKMSLLLQGEIKKLKVIAYKVWVGVRWKWQGGNKWQWHLSEYSVLCVILAFKQIT